MIKIIIHITKFIIATVTALLFASCNFNGNAIVGSGKITTEKRIVQGNFTKVAASNTIDVVIIQSDSTEITVKTDDNLQDEVITEVKDGTLYIKYKNNSYADVAKKTVTVKMPVIDKLEASSVASITSKGLIQGQDISLESSSASTIDLNIESDNITCDADSGSTIGLQGKALKTQVSASSGGSINAHKLWANEIHAEASSGGSVNVHPIVSLKASASSGGSVNYDNTPKTIEKTSSSGGTISQG